MEKIGSITVEITPSHGASISNIIDKIEKSGLEKMVDGFSVTDNPLAKLKMDAVLSAIKVQDRFKKPCNYNNEYER